MKNKHRAAIGRRIGRIGVGSAPEDATVYMAPEDARKQAREDALETAPEEAAYMCSFFFDFIDIEHQRNDKVVFPNVNFVYLRGSLFGNHAAHGGRNALC